ncbi:MAG: metallophosphoesterase [Nitrososphaeraceae archaeon]
MTKIGILSDTHDDLNNVREAIKLFNDVRVKYVIHAGDYVFPGLILEFRNLKPSIKLIGVLGNNDGESIGILNNFMKVNGDLMGTFGELKIDGLLIGIYHGTNNTLKTALINSHYYDVFICGHTHIKDTTRIGKTQILNPGSTHPQLQNDINLKNTYPAVIVFDTITKEALLCKI